MVSSFSEKYNSNRDAIEITATESGSKRCTICGGELAYRDRKLRKIVNLEGETRRYLLRRFRCLTCIRHHTEIPDVIQPYKHYDSETIQLVLDEDERAGLCVADIRTIQRWKEEFAESIHDIEQRIASVDARESGENVPLNTAGDLIKNIRTLNNRWLAFVMTLLINAGHKLCTRFAFCPASSSVRLSTRIENLSEEEFKNVKAIENSS